MKTISSGLAAMLASNVTTRATLWNIVRRDGVYLCFSDFDRDLVLGGDLYPAYSGFSAEAIETSGQLNVDNLEVKSFFADDGITEADVAAGLWDRARVRLMTVNWQDTSQGPLYQRWGELGTCRYQTGRGFVVELRGLMQALANNIGGTYGANCPHQLGDARCEVDTEALVQTVTVATVTSRREITVTGLTGVDNVFRYGIIEFTSGDNEGFRMEVRASTSGGGVSLQLPMPFEIAVGDTAELTPGCDKTEATCIAKFDNILNFGGFADIPGMDRLVVVEPTE